MIQRLGFGQRPFNIPPAKLNAPEAQKLETSASFEAPTLLFSGAKIHKANNTPTPNQPYFVPVTTAAPNGKNTAVVAAKKSSTVNPLEATEPSPDFTLEERNRWDFEQLVKIYPPFIQDALHSLTDEEYLSATNIKLRVGKPPELVLFEPNSPHPDKEKCLELSPQKITKADVQSIVKKVQKFIPKNSTSNTLGFGPNNRVDIPNTLHRVTASLNDLGEAVAVTARISPDTRGEMVELLKPYLSPKNNVLLISGPGKGKTTLLRAMGRKLAEKVPTEHPGLYYKRRVCIVDSCGEIGGGGDGNHPAIGFADKFQLPYDPIKGTSLQQYTVMQQVSRNEQPQTVIIDEIMPEDVRAVRSMAERDIQLIATVHGKGLVSVLKNVDAIQDLVGGFKSSTLTDERAEKLGAKDGSFIKEALCKTSPVTFNVAMELVDRNTVHVYENVEAVIPVILEQLTLAKTDDKTEENIAQALKAKGLAPKVIQLKSKAK